MNPLDELERLHREATPGPLRVAGYAGEHDESGADIRAGDKHIAHTYGGLRRASTPEEWRRYYADADILATSRNIVPQVIALARAVEAYRVPGSAGTFVPMCLALDALLQAIESEVSR